MLSHTTGYALRALGYLANNNGSSILVKEIAAHTGIPAPYLSKIIRVLARKHLVVTQRGIGGGVCLAQPAEVLTLYAVCIALEDPFTEERCMLSKEPCSSERACPAHIFCTTHRQQQREFLKETTLREIAVFEERNGRKLRGANGK